MGVEDLIKVGQCRAHFDGKGDLPYQVAHVWSHQRGTKQDTIIRTSHHQCHAIIGSYGQSTPIRGQGKTS